MIDVVLRNRVYLPCLYVYNKIDQISIEEVDRIARQPHSVVVSCNMKLNLDYMTEKIWEYLSLIRVYTKKRGGKLKFIQNFLFDIISIIYYLIYLILYYLTLTLISILFNIYYFVLLYFRTS